MRDAAQSLPATSPASGSLSNDPGLSFVVVYFVTEACLLLLC